MHLTSEDAGAFRKATDAFFGAIDLPRIDAKNGPPARHLHSRMPKGKSGILKMLCRLRMKLRMATGFLIEPALDEARVRHDRLNRQVRFWRIVLQNSSLRCARAIIESG